MGRNRAELVRPMAVLDASRVMTTLAVKAQMLLESEGDALLAAARDRWPRSGGWNRSYYRKRPHSADLFRVESTSQSWVLSYSIHNDARDGMLGDGKNRYAYMIETVKGGVIGNAWQLLIRKPVRKTMRQIQKGLLRVAQEAMGGT